MGRLMMGTRRAGGLAIAAWLGLGLAIGTPAAADAAAAEAPVFGRPTATAAFGDGLDFSQPITLDGPPSRVEFLLRIGSAAGPTVLPILPPASGGRQVLEHHVSVAESHVVPNTPFHGRWRVIDDDGEVWLGPEISRLYVDDRFDWRVAEGDLVRVHWSEGDQAFGERALRIGEEAVAETAGILGVTESEPIDFFIYADQEAFYDALGPSTRENVGGQAHPDIRTLFALIGPGDIDADWVDVVVPHELVHLVFATAVDNPYRAPPHWLNEGLAVYLSEGYTRSYRSAVEAAAGDGTIMPLDGLAGAFPTTFSRFNLAYAESTSAVERIVRLYDEAALVALIRSYQRGVTDDEAFQTALGVDLAEFEAAWLAELGAEPPVRHGPQPAPPGPLPPDWQGPAPGAATPAPGSQTASPGPAASPTGEAPGPDEPDDGLTGLGVAIAVLGGLLVGVGLIVILRRAGGARVR